jgi:hypothetical protein
MSIPRTPDSSVGAFFSEEKSILYMGCFPHIARERGGKGREKTNFESFFRITESNRLQVVPVKLFLTVPIVL